MQENPGLLMALQVAGWKWRICPGFVTKDGQKVPVAGGDWSQLATVDENKIQEWWNDKPYMWPGVVSGYNSCLVVDCDGPASVDYMRQIWNEIGGWPGGSGLIYSTPGRGGGLHCIWNWPKWLPSTFAQAKIYLDGGEVQLRGKGHFTLLGGARRPDLPIGQRAYVMRDEPGPNGPQEAPERLIRRLLAEAQTVSTRVGNAGQEVIVCSVEEAVSGGLREDGRKNLLAGVAWYYAIRGEPIDIVMEKVQTVNEACCCPPCVDSIVNAKVKYACERAEKKNKEFLEEGQKMIKLWKR